MTQEKAQLACVGLRDPKATPEGFETLFAIEIVDIPKYDDCFNRGAPM